MIIDTSKIRDLVASDMTGYRVSQLVNVSSQTYNAYKSYKKSVENMTLKTAEELMKVIAYELPSPIKLIAWEEGKLQSVENFNTSNELKSHLLTTDYFSWINDNDPNKALPDFSNVESVEDVQSILDDYNYSWWSMEVVTDEKFN
ncbi:hypothetical protein NE261_05255 [Enterococcus italicus]|uniref:hypothetical protein n=1 Tax=Enterococcus italicus TaxID=246144 RepID=UPI002072A79F|nr:hypothetical protein [Enterococcus italicus]MCM6931216.1 hypothetical protein [Enterococcus italicus]